MRDLHNRPRTPDGITAPIGIGTRIVGGQAAGRRKVEEEERRRLIADSLPMSIVHIDRDFRYRFANKTYESW
jgi:PAS domain-containing protein